MADNDENLLIATSCPLLSAAAQLSVLTQSKRQQQSVWVCGYLREWCQSVFHILLPDLAENRREKLRNFLRM